jgi:hypothetical protein
MSDRSRRNHEDTNNNEEHQEELRVLSALLEKARGQARIFVSFVVLRVFVAPGLAANA